MGILRYPSYSVPEFTPEQNAVYGRNLHEAEGLWDANWTAPTFQNSWTDFGGADAPGSYRLVGGLVYIRGTIKGGTMAAASFTLPTGYRPSGVMVFPAASNGAFGLFSVSTAGVVTPEVGSTLAFAFNSGFVPEN